MKFLSTALLCALFHLSEAYGFGETECSSTNGTGVVFRLTGRGLTYGLNKAYSSYSNKKFKMLFTIDSINKTINETNYWIDKLKLTNDSQDMDLKDFDVNIVPESKCLNISVKEELATMKGEVTCRSIKHRNHSQNCTIVAKMPWFFQLHIGRSTEEKNKWKYFTTEVCNSTDNCSLPINATTTEFTNCSPQQETLCSNEESLFRDFLRILLRDKLKNICTIVRFLINYLLNYYMKSINLVPDIGFNIMFWVDLTMPLDPVYNTTFLETFHKGNLHWYLTDEEYPNSPNTNFDLNTETDNSSMAYLWISRNVIKAALKGLQIHGVLHFKITADKLNTSGLNTTCRVGVCVGRLVPSLAKMYPNCFMDLDVYSLETPDILFEKDLLIINGKFIMYAYVRCPSTKRDVGIASLVGGVSMRIKLSMTNGTLHGKIDAIEPNLEKIDSELSDFDVQTVNFIIRSAVIVTIEPLLNQYGEKGVEIPIAHARMLNSSVRLIKDAIIIGSDIEADPKVSLNTV